MFQILGLGEEAEVLYRALLREGPLRVDSFDSPAESAIIKELRAGGLVYGEDLLTAARPGVALAGRLLERQQAMNATEALIAELESLYQANDRHRTAQVPVEVVTDAEHVRKTFSHIEQTTRHELLCS
ncbi:hypothetical protein BKM31_16065 [[Actinomadura] parvosata subsp. kistnae]|uniref:Uncharacterized protein n=1 Tax=[Actinomadura] parvosata subsp. kistnae TaxID=1909395 RepID=A0A1U9ZXU5_9ACTN|nr:hypothetical protein [Nonomuraea sp. ATCC 55076]AQZ62775.1 hypothetical protein BKM31_16065 [Nonomuraea sp. ATCC 55076]